jgi:hypothetical protein
MTILNKTLFPVPLRPSTAKVSPRPTLKLIPFRTFWLPKDLNSFSTTIAGMLPASSSWPCRVVISEAVAMFFSPIAQSPIKGKIPG